MSLPKRAIETSVKRSDEETQDEIEQIMSEIEQLQKEIGQTEPVAAGAAPAHGAGATRAKASDGPSIESGFTSDDPLEEFRASAGSGASDGGLEETLAELKAEESGGKGVFDEDEDEIDEEPVAEAPKALSMREAPETARETREAIARASREVEEAFEDHKTGTDEPRMAEEEEEMSMRDHDEAGKAGDGALTMTLKGNMTLKLQYECDGQVVSIGFADQALRVQLADGTEFKIPMRRAPARRAA